MTVVELKQKNDRLMLQRTLLLQQWDQRVRVAGGGSLLGTFIFAPFILGVVAPFLVARRGLKGHVLRLMLFPALKKLFLQPQVVSQR